MEKNRKVRILIFIDWFLPGHKSGGPVRSVANMVEHLSDEFDFYIVTRNSDYLDNIPYNNVISNNWTDFSKNVKIYYTTKNKLSLKLWRKLIREKYPDVIYINGVYSKYFSIFPIIAAKKEKKAKIIIATRGMLAQSAIKIKNRKKKLFLLCAIFLRLYEKIEFHATNYKEKEDIYKTLRFNGKINIAANLPRKAILFKKDIIKTSKILRLIIVSRIAPEKNTLFALCCLKNIEKEIKIEVDIYGQIYDEKYWQKCIKITEQLPENVVIKYFKSVLSEKVVETIEKYHALFLPTLGENFGHIILESFMAARPVIISDQTPWTNLQKKNAGWDLPLIENKFVEVIKFLSEMEQSDYDKLSNGAFNLAKEYLDDKKLIEKYRKMFL